MAYDLDQFVADCRDGDGGRAADILIRGTQQWRRGLPVHGRL